MRTLCFAIRANRVVLAILCGGMLAIPAAHAQQSGAPSNDSVIRLKGIVNDLDNAASVAQKNWLQSSREQQAAYNDWLKAMRAQNHVDPALRTTPERVNELARVRDEKTEANNRSWQAFNDVRETRRDVREWLQGAQAGAEPGDSAAPRDIPRLQFGKMPTLERLKLLEQAAGKLKNSLQGNQLPPDEAVKIFRRHLEGDTNRPDAAAQPGTPFFNRPANPTQNPAEPNAGAIRSGNGDAGARAAANNYYVAPSGAPGSPTSRARLKCPECAQWFYDSDMPLHLESAHQDFLKDSPRDPKVDRPAPPMHQSRCGVCGKMIPDDELARHVDAHRPRAQCPHCNETYYSTDLAAHIAARHPATVECPKCHQNFYERDLARHLAAAHPTPPRTVNTGEPLAVEYSQKPYAVNVGAVNTITARFWNNTDRRMRAGAQLVTFNNNVSVSPSGEREFWIEPYSVSGWYNWQVTVRVAGEQTIQMNRRVIDN